MRRACPAVVVSKVRRVYVLLFVCALVVCFRLRFFPLLLIFFNEVTERWEIDK